VTRQATPFEPKHYRQVYTADPRLCTGAALYWTIASERDVTVQFQAGGVIVGQLTAERENVAEAG
jgi:hypothetical protein